MVEDKDFENGDQFIDHRNYSTRQRQFKSSNRKSFQIILGIFIILIFVIALIYFIGRITSKTGTNILNTRIDLMEQKMIGFEKQIEDIQTKISSLSPDQSLIQRIDTIEQRLQLLEKQKSSSPEIKQKPQPISKAQTSTKKRFHTVEKGETLYKIAKKYNLSVDELIRINGLSKDKPVKIGQKLLVSTGD